MSKEVRDGAHREQSLLSLLPLRGWSRSPLTRGRYVRCATPHQFLSSRRRSKTSPPEELKSPGRTAVSPPDASLHRGLAASTVEQMTQNEGVPQPNPRPVALRVTAGIFGFIIGVWALFEPVTPASSSCTLLEKLVGDCSFEWSMFFPQVVGVGLAFAALVYAFE